MREFEWTNVETKQMVEYISSGMAKQCAMWKKTYLDTAEFGEAVRDHFSNLKQLVLENPNLDALDVLLQIGPLEKVNYDQIGRFFAGQKWEELFKAYETNEVLLVTAGEESNDPITVNPIDISCIILLMEFRVCAKHLLR